PSDGSKDPPGLTRRAALQGAGVLALAAAMGVATAAPAAAATTDQFGTLCLAQVGKRYVFGAAGPSTFDCSGLIYWSLGQLGITSPRPSDKIINFTQPISVKQGIATRGALLYYGVYGDRRAHIAVSLGDGRVVEAANERLGVRVHSAFGYGWTHAGVITQLTSPPPPAPDPVPDVQEDEMLLIRDNSTGAVMLVIGGVGSSVLGPDYAAYQAAGIPVAGVSADGFAIATQRYLQR
ncbi:MAG: NlpC/P60 family protein, partial [Oerskovia sp.]|nr:NlpC/P60 family protein [Oerskovia sp.]